jgi:hypothetical protein
MMLKWHFLTGALPELKRVWKAYGIEAAIVHGQVDHTPAMYVIDQRGRMIRLYWTRLAYADVKLQAQVLAQEISGLLPDPRLGLPDRRPLRRTLLGSHDPARLADLRIGATAGPGKTVDANVARLADQMAPRRKP